MWILRLLVGGILGEALPSLSFLKGEHKMVASIFSQFWQGLANPADYPRMPDETIRRLQRMQQQMLIEHTQRSRQVKKAFLLDIVPPKKAKRKKEQHLLIVRPGEDPKVFSLDEEKEKVRFLHNIDRGQFQEMIRSLGDC